MSASLKPIRKSALQGMRQLKSKISDLETQYQRYVEHRQKEITTLLTCIDLTQMEDLNLTGAFLFIKEKEATNDSLMEKWHAAGMRFLRQNRTNKPRLSEGNAPSQKINRSPQKQPQSGEA